MFSCTPCWKILRKSFSSSNRATSREEEKTPASNAPSAVALRRAPVPCVATTCPLLSISMAQEALVSFISFVNTIEMVPSSRSEMTRFVSCSMDEPPSVYTPSILCHPSLYITLYREPQEFHHGSLSPCDAREQLWRHFQKGLPSRRSHPKGLHSPTHVHIP